MRSWSTFGGAICFHTPVGRGLWSRPSDAAIASHCHKVSLLNMAWYTLALMFFLPAGCIDAPLLERGSIHGLPRP